MIENGATTFWEQWNGYWSQAHSCFTSADNWLYQGLGGIQADPSAPGFKKFIIKPDLVGDVSWVKAHYDSPYGRISSHWKREGETFTLKMTVPPNSTGVLYLPAASQSTVLVNGEPVDKNGFVRFMKHEQGRVVFHVDSGTYTFTAKMDQ
jgi:alpha-L-rhamnosidase